MNCGLGNLDTLKKHLLAKSLVNDARFDEVIADIGRGVAALFVEYCDRAFAREAGATEIFPADRNSFLVQHYPLESVSKSEYKQNETDGWVEQDSDFITIFDNAAGIIYTDQAGDVGESYEQVRFTLTGGYHIEFLEPDEGVTALPSGATALPADVKLAWLLHCRVIWDRIDKLGAGLVGGQPGKFVANDQGMLELSPQVKQILEPYQRFAIV